MATTKRTAPKKTAVKENGVGTSVSNAVGKTDGMSKEEATAQLKKAVNIAKKLSPTGPAALEPSTNFSSELNNIDFRKMIGGPLQACVDAQVASALATVNFIKEVGFEKDEDGKPTGKLNVVDFSYKKTGDDGKETETVIKVPLIATLPIPCLRIEYVEINFNVKLNSVETSNTSLGIKVGVEASGGFGPVSFKASVSVQRNSSTGIKVEKEYSLNVKVRAVQDEMPAGLEKILNLLAA